MRSSRRRSAQTGSSPGQAAAAAITNRQCRRITKTDIRYAGFRRWDGRARVTTDWVNVFQEPELCFADGDVFIYLREPGQSSRGPSFRVHKRLLREKGFASILSKCIERSSIPSTANCVAVGCPGCQHTHPMSELYIPAPQHADMDTVLNHHITTRNFFAWLYNIPLTGRTLGLSLIALKDRIDFYRPGTNATTGLEVVSFAEAQRYLDFRECIDHALAALLLAETLRLEDLWVDAFAHCVGMSDRNIKTSIEYELISENTKAAIKKSRVEMEIRLDRTSNAFRDFFEYSLSGNVLGLPATARDHFDRFRSWLHSFYIEHYGFWPPVGFSDHAVQRKLYVTMYSDMRNLYHHLADAKSTAEDVQLLGVGGVCALQNVQAFDRQHEYESLPRPLPMLPVEPDVTTKPLGLQRRKSWNPISKRKIEKDARNALRVQALISASNRDWSIMDCLLVRRYSEFEVKSIVDETETISMVDGRKVRWILVYAILQTLISVMQAPTQVRNTEGLTYSLCCHPPKTMPWPLVVTPPAPAELERRTSYIEPDTDLLRTMTVTESSTQADEKAKRERRRSLPARTSSGTLRNSFSSSTVRSTSLRRLMTRRSSQTSEAPAVPKATSPKQASFCEIIVQGYGNGLSEAEVISSASVSEAADSASSQTLSTDGSESSGDEKATPKASPKVDPAKSAVTEEPLHDSPTLEQVPDLTPASSISMSRGSSNASDKDSARGRRTDGETPNPEADDQLSTRITGNAEPTLQELLAATRIQKNGNGYDNDMNTSGLIDMNGHERAESKDLNKILDERGHTRTVHINTSTWDEFLRLA